MDSQLPRVVTKQHVAKGNNLNLFSQIKVRVEPTSLVRDKDESNNAGIIFDIAIVHTIQIVVNYVNNVMIIVLECFLQ